MMIEVIDVGTGPNTGTGDTIYEAALDWMWEQLSADEPIGPTDDDPESKAIAAVIEAARKRSPLYAPPDSGEVK